MTSGLVYNTNTGALGGTLLDVHAPTAYSWNKVGVWAAGDAAPAVPRPLFVWAHGGGFTTGSKTQADAVWICRQFASRGYIALSIDYRMFLQWSQNSRILATCDMRAAVRWAKANAVAYSVDTTRIVTGGDSAGGLTAVLAAISEFEEANGNNGFMGALSRPNAVLNCWGGLWMGETNLSSAPYSTNILTGALNHLYTVHGDADGVVGVQHSRYLDSAIKTLIPTSPNVHHELKGAGHTCWFRIGSAQGFYEDALDLVAAHLKLRLAL